MFKLGYHHLGRVELGQGGSNLKVSGLVTTKTSQGVAGGEAAPGTVQARTSGELTFKCHNKALNMPTLLPLGL